MTQFLRLIEVARAKGVFSEHFALEGDYSEWITTESPDCFWKRVELCQPFVFNCEITHDTAFSNEPIDPPFPIFSVEESGLGTLIVGNPHAPDLRFRLGCLVACEIKPRTYYNYALLYPENPSPPYHRRMDIDSAIVLTGVDLGFAGNYLRALLPLMKKMKTGAESVRQTVKLGSGKSSRIHRIRRVIHVAPKGEVRKKPEAFRNVNWSHRFSVRGTWVTLRPNRIGKDREGIYCIPGKTWREEYVKGPEHLPFIKKVRIVKESDNETQPGSDIQSDKRSD